MKIYRTNPGFSLIEMMTVLLIMVPIGLWLHRPTPPEVESTLENKK